MVTFPRGGPTGEAANALERAVRQESRRFLGGGAANSACDTLSVTSTPTAAAGSNNGSDEITVLRAKVEELEATKGRQADRILELEGKLTDANLELTQLRVRQRADEAELERKGSKLAEASQTADRLLRRAENAERELGDQQRERQEAQGNLITLAGIMQDNRFCKLRRMQPILAKYKLLPVWTWYMPALTVLNRSVDFVKKFNKRKPVTPET